MPYILAGFLAYSLLRYIVYETVHRYRRRGLSEKDYQYLKYLL